MLKKSFRLLFICFALIAGNTSAQTNEFTYQGKLNDGALSANGSYDFLFELHNSPSSSTPLASSTQVGITVTNGVFTVRLNFTAPLFDGTDRFLKISVKPAGSPNPFTPLAPYQPITSAPYAIKSRRADIATNAVTADLASNADRLGGVTADQFVQTTDARMTDARAPLPGSANYVQNTTSQQSSSNFNVSGTGTANVFNAATQFNIGGNRAFVAQGGGSQNVFAGINSGTANTIGFGNSFVGNLAGNANSTGNNNSFFGTDSGRNNIADGNSFFGRSSGFATTTGTSNAFFGLDSGRFNQTGSQNAFFGREAGFNNTATGNSFFGYRAGFNNTVGDGNAFFGIFAGQANSSGFGNSFFGHSAGLNNTTGDNNSFFGVSAGRDTTTGNFNSFFGVSAGTFNTTGTNNSFLGENAGNRNTTGFANSFVGRSAGFSNTTGMNNSYVGMRAGVSNTTGNENSFYGFQAGQTNTTGSNNTAVGNNADVGSGNLTFATAIGSGTTVTSSNTISLGRSDGSDVVLIPGLLKINSLGTNGATALCISSSGLTGIISFCSSSLRYKTNVRTFNGGIDMLRRFRPVTFDWKGDNKPDIGFVAEEVNEIEPLLTTRNADGEIEGVKYAQITTVLVNAVKEQQKIIDQQQEQINALKKLVCAQNPTAEICKEQE